MVCGAEAFIVIVSSTHRRIYFHFNEIHQVIDDVPQTEGGGGKGAAWVYRELWGSEGEGHVSWIEKFDEMEIGTICKHINRNGGNVLKFDLEHID